MNLKTRLTTVLCLTFICICNNALCQSQKLIQPVISNDFPSLGLISTLSFIKQKSESFILEELLIVESNGGPPIGSIKKYLEVKGIFDQIIFQLTTDLKDKNSLKLYRQLNELIINSTDVELIDASKSPAIIQQYVNALKIAYHIFQKNMSPANKKSAALADVDPIAAVTLIYTIFKDARDARTAKVALVCTALDSLRLAAIDTVKPAEK